VTKFSKIRQIFSANTSTWSNNNAEEDHHPDDDLGGKKEEGTKAMKVILPLDENGREIWSAPSRTRKRFPKSFPESS